ncbi:hypothetical protein I6G47_00725 [Delftia lacustris]|uniref:Uncharacterized protein n=1 Tax=Delftia lacustris TaxID=558537 RepID=A0A7T2YTH3_9BURK|nr:MULTISPECIES: hypothetical protein [Delftia]QPS81642.1 hypothetical protein I6G47_00725 [Delftia lacustris]
MIENQMAISALQTAAPEEFCFLWRNWWAICMTKSEWASWVQAIGSVAAIFSGFYLARKTLRLQHEQQLQRDAEEKRIRNRMQYCVLADLFDATEAWGNELERTINDRENYSVDSSIYMAESLADRLRSVSNEQLPAVDSIRRINMAIISVDALIAGLKVVQSLEGEAEISARQTVKFRANRLANLALVDKDFCDKQAKDISTAEEISISEQAEISRAQSLSELFSK